MKITFLTPRVDAERFSGGIYCIFKYAQGLVDCGHQVTVVAYPGSSPPRWIRYTGEFISAELPQREWLNSKSRKRSHLLKRVFEKPRYFDEDTIQSLKMLLVSDAIPASDVIIATLWETVRTAITCKKGSPVYFMQHFESVFYEPNDIAYYQAEASYGMPIFKIANSSWLLGRITELLSNREQKHQIALCPNAVDLGTFYPDPTIQKLSRHNREINLISYGGRNVVWKGFREMAEGVRIARAQLPDYSIQWNVYGDAELPPDNPIAKYNHLGFLNPDELAREYNRNDVLLSASWYESFPLFPIEGMACGLAVISTQPGTEDYAIDGENALIVQPKDATSIARAIVALAKSTALCKSLGEAGRRTALQFNWDRSVNTLEQILSEQVLGGLPTRRTHPNSKL